MDRERGSWDPEEAEMPRFHLDMVGREVDQHEHANGDDADWGPDTPSV